MMPTVRQNSNGCRGDCDNENSRNADNAGAPEFGTTLAHRYQSPSDSFRFGR